MVKMRDCRGFNKVLFLKLRGKLVIFTNLLPVECLIASLSYLGCRWDESNTDIVDFDPPLIKPEPEDEILLRSYPHPQPTKFMATNNVKEPSLTKTNYVGRMHELLYIEEMAQFEQLSEFNVMTNLDLTKSYLLMPTSANSSTAKYTRQGELFGKMALGSSLSEDTPAGRLILTNCNILYLSIPSKVSELPSLLALYA